MIKTVHLLITGKVQGVFYRASSRKEAIKWGLKGWVRNTDSGAVEMIVTGDEQSLNNFIKWCGLGPDRAKVENVTKTDAPLTHFDAFKIK
ncbi:MAG: acylphosphatase [Chitinophagaceae bacterium]|nr:acylphosphatase [Chitinophagaceae bacterium]